MSKKHCWLTAILSAALCGCGISTAQVAAPGSPPVSPAASAPHGLNIVFVGDSNTENGFVTGALAQELEAKYGFFGSGWRALADNSAKGRDGSYNGGLTVKNEGNWKKLYIAPQGDKDAFLSPCGVALQGDDTAAATFVEFTGRAVQVFNVAQPGGGSFTAQLDDGAAQRVATGTETDAGIKAVTLSAPAAGRHTLTLRIANGKVLLAGVNALQNPAFERVALVHKWGRGYAHSGQFAAIAPEAWRSGLRAVGPDVVVFMLGTNDAGINGTGTQAYGANIAQLVARTREAVPSAKVLLLSTIPAGVFPAFELQQSYYRNLESVAGASGARFFDVWTWAGGSKKSVRERDLSPEKDALHWNQNGGRQLAAALLPLIEEMAKTPAPTLPAAPLSAARGATTPQVLKEAIPGAVLNQIGLWLSADGAVQLDEQSRVSRWENLRSAAAPQTPAAGQVVAAWRPKFVKNAVNGLPALDFDGQSSVLCLPQSAGFRAFTVVARARKTGARCWAKAALSIGGLAPAPPANADSSRRKWWPITKSGVARFLSTDVKLPPKLCNIRWVSFKY